MIREFALPDLGEGLPEAELVAWQVAEGDTVALNQTIAEVETAKAVVELPSPYAGRVTRLHAGAGDVVEVGSALISFDVAVDVPPDDRVPEPGAAREAEASVVFAASDPTAREADEKAQPNLVGYGAAPRSSGRPRRRPRVAVEAYAIDVDVLDAAPHDVLREHESAEARVERLRERPRSTPPVRRLARDHGVDLALVAGTGPEGLITRADVERYVQRVNGAPSRTADAAASPSPASASDERVTRTPIRGVRKHTAAAMVRSAFTAPHVTTFLTVDVTSTMELVASLRDDRALAGHRIGVLAVAAKAVCLALGRHPSLNSAWDEEAGEILTYHDVHLGIAAATDRGLVVPNIRRAQEMSLVELADAIGELAATARAGRTTPADMTGGTFSITNVGVFGIDAGTPILNPGEAGILALGSVRRRPWEHRGDIALREVMTLALSFDHRLVDGEQGARFLTEVGGVLSDPGRAMLLR